MWAPLIENKTNNKQQGNSSSPITIYYQHMNTPGIAREPLFMVGYHMVVGHT